LRTLFSQLGSYFVLVGAFYGTFASWILILVQNHFKILKFRNPEEYYITYIPFELSVVDTLIYLILFLSIGWVVIQLSSKALRRLNPIHLLRI